MKGFAALFFACLIAGAAHARPVFIQESARIANPDPAFPAFANDVAIDGNEALITLGRYVPNYPDGADEYFTSVWLFRRVNGTWSAVRQISSDSDYYYIWDNGITMRGGVAALALNPTQIFERVNGEWVAAPTGNLGSDDPGDSISIDNGRIFYGGTSGTFTGTLIEKTPGDGVWRVSQRMYGEARGGDDEHFGREVDISGNYAVVISPYSDDFPSSPSIPNINIFYNFGGDSGWGVNWRIDNSTEAPLGSQLQIRGEEIFVSGNEKTGTFVFRRAPSSAWPLAGHLQPAGGYMGSGTANKLRKSDLYVMQQSFDYDRNAYVINAFAKNSNGNYSHVATLVSSDGASLGDFAISGRTVLASCGNQACWFELPAAHVDPAPVQETFSGATPTGWTLSAGSQFTIVQSGTSRVLRQAETASPATHTALLSAANWSNQSVQADVRPTAFSGSDRWVGVATRYRDASNYYYVTLRSSGSLSLRKNVNGVFTSLSSVALPVTLNRNYRLRVESIGTRHRVFADGALLIDVNDSAHASGRTALLTYRSAAEFDNVLVTPSAGATLWATGPSERGFDYYWTTSGPGLWSNSATRNGARIYSQYSVAGDARAATGVAAGDQTLEVRARATTFAGTGTGDRWFGALARYSNETNYYYLSLRSGGSVSLRKVANGTVTVLGSVTLPVTLGRWYSLRLEAVGSRLRGYVDGNLLLEATDSTHPQGKTGLVTYRTAAEYAGYRAVRP